MKQCRISAELRLALRYSYNSKKLPRQLHVLFSANDCILAVNLLY